MYSDRLTQGLAEAARLHAAQTRKGVDTPYLSHLLGVASLIIEYGGDEDAVIAGLLHDAVEDCGGQPRLDAIRSAFGDIVADTVMACSDSVTAEIDDKAPWLERKRSYIAAVAHKSGQACLVTACDKLHNATAILCDHVHAEATGAPSVWTRFGDKSREQTVAYYSAMRDALKWRIPSALATRLDGVIGSLESVVDPGEHAKWVRRLSPR